MLEFETNFVEQGTIEISTDVSTKVLYCGANTLHLEMDHGKLSAAVQNKDGRFTVKPDHMTQLARVTTKEILDAFLKNAFFKINQLDNGDFKFEVNQKAKGGIPPKEIDKNKADKGNKGGGGSTKEKCTTEKVCGSGSVGGKEVKACVEVTRCTQKSTK